MRAPLVVAVALSLMAVAAPAAAGPVPDAPGCPLFPADNVWHADVSSLPVHPRSAAWKSNMGGDGRRLHPDFGPSDGAMPYGIPYTVVDSSHSRTAVDFDYASESDPGPYPFGPDTPIEGGADASGDRHALMLDGDACVLYELFDARWSDSGSTAGSGAVFDLRSHALRPRTWTSADAAGLPILPGLLRLDEVRNGLVDHPIRMTAQITDRSFIWPARHQAGARSDANLPPMGAWFRMRADVDISRFRPDTQVVLRAMKRHGMILADNGSNWFFTGTAEPDWPEALLSELKSLTAASFEAVDTSSLMVDPDSGQVRGAAADAGPAPPPVDLPPGEVFFAEGSTRPGIQEYITLLNPSSGADATVALDHQFGTGPPLTTVHTVGAGRRVTVDVNAEVGPGRDVSTRVRVTSGPGVMAERPMYFSNVIGGLVVEGGHVGTGAPSPARRWLFAEGTTRPGFQQFLTVQNPHGAGAAVVTIRFHGTGLARTLTVPAASRATVDVNVEVGPGRDVAVEVLVDSGPTVVVERPLYVAGDVGVGGVVSDGTVAAGAVEPRREWSFAEGTTRSGFREFLSLQNPSASEAARVRVDYQGGGGATSEVVVPPEGRATIDVNAAVGPERDVSAVVRVVEGPGVVAERPMYFSRPLVGGRHVDGAHVAMGAAAPGRLFLFAEGTTRPGFQEYVTLQNPSGTEAARVAVHYRVPAGETAPPTTVVDVPPVGRVTVDVNGAAGAGRDVAVVVAVTSGPAVGAERPLYFRADPGLGAVVDGGSVATGRSV